MHYCPLNSNRQQSVPSEQKGKPAKQAGRLYNNCCRSGYKSRVQGRGRRVEKKENHDEKKKVFTVVLSWLWRTSTYVRISTCVVVVVVCIGKGRTERGETTWVSSTPFLISKLCNQVHSLDLFVVQNSGDFLC